ncbi:MAG TPA: metal ABC transporter permease, partial [Polyangiaceae bacterium]|nr:metal ABC transporter permease [Polyangiaceae bacterium]
MQSSTSAPAAVPSSSAEGELGREFDDLLREQAHTSRPQVAQGSNHPPHEADHSPHDHVGMPSWDEFASGWDLGLYQDPILCGVLAGLVLGVLGVFVVLRRAVFVTAAVSQSAGLGVALAFLLQLRFDVALHPVVGAFVLALLATMLLAGRYERFRLPKETLLGFTYIGASASAILVSDRITQEAHDISAILFGTAVLVRPVDLSLVTAVGAVVLIVLGVFYKGLVFAGFDPEGARVQGLPVRFLDLLFWVLVAAEVSVATRAIGALPVFAFAVLPAMAALSSVERLRSALAVAAVVGALS